MSKVIKYKTTCYKCGKVLCPEIEKRKLKDGLIKTLPFLTRHNGKWKGHCNECYENKKLDRKNE